MVRAACVKRAAFFFGGAGNDQQRAACQSSGEQRLEKTSAGKCSYFIRAWIKSGHFAVRPGAVVGRQ